MVHLNYGNIKFDFKNYLVPVCHGWWSSQQQFLQKLTCSQLGQIFGKTELKQTSGNVSKSKMTRIKRFITFNQSYVIKSAPWAILWFRILEIFSAEYIKRLCVFMFQTCSNSQLLRRVLWINAELTIFSSLNHKNTQPIYIFSRENPQNSEPQNGLRRGLDFIALVTIEWLWPLQVLASSCKLQN